MSVSSASIKKTALEVIKNNFMKIFVATAVIMSVWFIIENFGALLYKFTQSDMFLNVVSISCVFVLLPLFIGYIRYCWRMLAGVSDNPITIFYYFSNHTLYLKVLKFIISILVRVAVCYFILYIPVLALDLITGTWLYSTFDLTMPMWTINLSNIASILKILAIVVTAFAVMKYYLSLMLFVADENIDTGEAVHLSTVISKRSKLDFLSLAFSFVLWIAVSLLSIPMLFTVPYFTFAYLLHATYSVSDFNEQISHISYDDIPTFIAGV